MDRANMNRVRARAAISSFPGIHLRMLQRVLGTSFSTVRYHVSNLEKEGEIVRRTDSRYERLYPCGTSEAMQSMYATLHRKTVRDLLQVVCDHHNSSPTISDLANLTSLSTSTIAECVKQLSEVGLVTRAQGADGRFRYEIQDVELVKRLLASFRRSMIDIASDNLIDLWDF